MANPYAHVTYDGHTVNVRTAAMLDQMSSFLGYPLTVLQGSYNPGGVGASGGTHDGGGAVDLAPYDWLSKVKVARQVGFAAWHRTAIPGEWPEHVHMIAIGDLQMSDAAHAQVQDYYNHTDGLVDNAHDPTWRPNVIVPFHYPLDEVNLTNTVIQAKAAKPISIPSVKHVQKALNIKTGTHLTVDGVFGPQTHRAYTHYEAQNGGNGDGIPGKLLHKLGLALFNVK